MKVILTICLILVYLLIGYVITSVMTALDPNSWDDDLILFFGTVLWPIFTVPSIIISIVAKIVIWLGNKIAVYPISIALIIKSIIERKRKENSDEDHHST